MPANNHPADLAAIDALHTRYCDALFGSANDRLMAFQDAAYAMGRARGKIDATPQWISVDDQLPPLCIQVLATNSSAKTVAACFRIPNNLWIHPGEPGEPSRRVDGVTHWMPLPAAPGVPA